MLARILGLIAFAAVMGVVGKVVNDMYQRSIEQAEAAKNAGDNERYVVKIPRVLGFACLANVGLAAIILAFQIFIMVMGDQPGDGMIQFCFVYAGLFLFLYAGFKIWWITVDGDEMEIHRFLRPTRKARFSDVERVREDRWHQLVVYVRGGKRLVTVNLLNDNRSRFAASLARAGVDMSAIPAADEMIREVQAKQKHLNPDQADDTELGA